MNTSFTVEPLQVEDIDEFIQVQWVAFEPIEADMVMPMIWPQGLQPDLMRSLRVRVLRSCGNDLEARCFVVREPASRRIMAVSWWSMDMDPPLTREQVDAAFERSRRQWETSPPVQGANVELASAFQKSCFYGEHATVQGRPYMCLQVLATLPAFRRRGLGVTLLRHGLQKADELNLPVYLDSGHMGKPMYEQNGFKVTGDLPFDGREHGGRSEGKHWCMLRPAKRETRPQAGDPGT